MRTCISFNLSLTLMYEKNLGGRSRIYILWSILNISSSNKLFFVGSFNQKNVVLSNLGACSLILVCLVGEYEVSFLYLDFQAPNSITLLSFQLLSSPAV